MKLSVRERILLKTTIDPDTGCWMWQGFRSPTGYGTMGIGKRTCVLVHRAAWSAFGMVSIPSSHELHHVCENKLCCNPAHLRLTTRREHILDLSPNNIAFKAARVTHCPYGHSYPDKVTLLKNGKRARICRPCANRRVKEFYQRNPEKYRAHIRHGSELRRQKRLLQTHNEPKVVSS